MLKIFITYADSPINFSYGFQDPATQWMLGIVDLHDNIVYFLIIILTVVLWFLKSALDNPDHLANLHHGNLIEVIWTITPAMILWVIGLPSLKLLYMMDEILDAELTVKAIANQWQIKIAINKNRYFENRKKILKKQYKKYEKSPKKLNPNWVTGFVDGQGCFTVKKMRRKEGRREIVPAFRIALIYNDLEILKGLKNYFKVGSITIQKNEARKEIKGLKNAIEYIIPHFDQYPQLTKKQADYLLWKEIVLLENSKEYITSEGFTKCLSLKANFNKGLNNTFQIQFPDRIPITRPIIRSSDIINPFWISGQTAGSGYLNINITKQKTQKIGYQISAVLNLAQHTKDQEQLKLIRKNLDCGNIFSYKEESILIICKIKDINNKIKTHFTLYPLMNIKQKHFLIWYQIINMIVNLEHLTEEGLFKIRYLRYYMRKAN